ncbi:hypothetical protein M758_1G067000 [Ceratodon purpureus]|nr:hypothetical protein M758_1G067000 [Ceratodon purpureus]
MNNFSMITMATLGNCTLILLLTPTASASFALHAPELHALPVPTHAKLDTPVKLSKLMTHRTWNENLFTCMRSKTSQFLSR